MNAEELAKLLLLPSDAPKVVSCLNYFGVKKAPKLKKGDNDTYSEIPEKGIAFLFVDEAYLKELKYQDIGDGPLLLKGIILYGKDDEYSTFTGTLPKGLTFNDGREDAQKKLGPSTGWYEDFLSEAWDIETYRLIVKYEDDLKSIFQVQLVLIPR